MGAVIRLLSLTVLLASPATAQEPGAQLRGIIFKADGTPAPRVSMRITHEWTGERREFVSDRDGRYAVTGLFPGTYRVETVAGFEPATAVRTSLVSGQDLELDIRLGLSSIAMHGDARPMVVPDERRFAGSRTRVDRTFIDSLPLDGRNILDLALLAPGVVPGNVALAANGTDEPFTSYYVDGFYDTEPLLGTPAARVAIDSVDELDVQTATFDAAAGHSAGPQVSLITRSATNQPHGGAFSFFGTDADRVQVGGFGGGPLAASRTFLFGSYQFTDESGEAALEIDSGHLLAIRADHVFNGSSRATARYALDGADVLTRRGQQAGMSLQTPFGGSLTNDVRFELTRVGFGDFADAVALAESATYRIGNSTTWTNGEHLIAAGVEWFGLQRGLDSNELAGTTWGFFVQDSWRALPAVSISAGVRLDRVSPDGAESDSMISPRLGFAWTADEDAQTVVHGGYGKYRNVAAVASIVPHEDGWTFGVRRRIGLTRILEAEYVGTHVDDLLGGVAKSRYDALQLGFEQRSQLGVSALVSYTYGKWTETLEGSDEGVRAPLDSRHRVSTGFVVALPFGDERRWLSDGWAAAVLGNMELSGILTLQTGRPVPGARDRQAPSHRNVDVGLLKNLAIGSRTLQLRFETFNLTDRENLERGRRFQFGGRVVF